MFNGATTFSTATVPPSATHGSVSTDHLSSDAGETTALPPVAMPPGRGAIPSQRSSGNALSIDLPKCPSSSRGMATCSLEARRLIEMAQVAVGKMAAHLIEAGTIGSAREPVAEEFRWDPPFEATSFVSRFISRSGCSPIVVLLAFYYLHKITRRFSKLRIRSCNAYRTVFVASCAAAKYVDDMALRFRNCHWVSVGGSWLNLPRFNVMEREFLSLLSFDLSLNRREFAEFCDGCGVDSAFWCVGSFDLEKLR